MKQRLIGAAVLVALAVIFLPMLLQRPAPESGAENVPLDVPGAPQRNIETRELPLTPIPATPSASPAVPADDPNRVVTVDADVAEKLDARPEDDPVAAPPVAAAPERPLPRDVASDADAAKAAAAAAAAAAPEPPPAAVTGGRYAVALGSFGNSANATALKGRLQAAGVPVLVDTVQVGGKPATRLRAGPFGQRAEAERARISAQRIEPTLKPVVVALDAEAPVPAPATGGTGFAVQVAALSSERDAQALRDRLRSGGLAAFVDAASTEGGRVYRVRVGPEADRTRAEQLKATVKQKFDLDGLVVSHP